MVEYNAPDAMNVLLQDLYTPQGYNPAEYTLLGYDPNMYGNVDPMYSYYNPAEMGMSQPAQAMADQSMAPQAMAPQDIAAQNAAVEAAAAANQEAARLRGDVVEWDPSQGISALQDPFEQERVLREADYRGLIWDEQRKNAWDAMGSQIYKDGKGARAMRDMTFRYGPDGRIKYAQYEGP